ncbi:lytic transglycosylase domain-containing protein [Amycolatopsis sulphurea]|uniref:lytic transglycosylase domain-containing protein n=1 Tax=Amycolatopsis sulphurea TaxID=76022 RepID=UPI00368DC1F1
MAVRRGRYRVRRGVGRHPTVAAVVVGVLGVVPVLVGAKGVAAWMGSAPAEHSVDAALVQGYDPRDTGIRQIAVDGRLPGVPSPPELPAYDLPAGPLGIPASALAAYRDAAAVLGREQPGCHLDWALVGSIGRIESGHARGGYVDAAGATLEPILGPELNGIGPYAAIPDTDHGALDRDTVWDRAVGPFQFIPATWPGYASDGNGDGRSDPNNLFDASLAAGRYLCSGGLDLANPDQLRTGVYRYNNSDSYVDTVILWAEGYRKGADRVPDSKVPVGNPSIAPAPGLATSTPLPAPLPPVTTAGPPPITSLPPSSTTTPPPTTGTPTTSPSPTCVSVPPSSTSASSTSPASTPTLPPCDTATSTAPGSPSSGSTAEIPRS